MNLKPWLLAARPKTLHASLVPVIVGASLAGANKKFHFTASLVCFSCAILIQVGTNYTNDLFDFLKGADTAGRVGPQRALNSGLVTVKQMSVAIAIVFGLAFLLGMYLVYLGGTTIFLIGVISIIAGILYTAGPYPLAYIGMGDVFSFLFFGVVATMGTYFANTLSWSLESFLASVPVGGLITAILVVNNYRDLEQDAQAGKNTLAVKFGRKFSKYEYLVLLSTAYIIPLVFYILYSASFTAFVLLPLLTLPYAIKLYRLLNELQGPELNKLLELTAKFSAVYGILLSLGFLL